MAWRGQLDFLAFKLESTHWAHHDLHFTVSLRRHIIGAWEPQSKPLRLDSQARHESTYKICDTLRRQGSFNHPDSSWVSGILYSFSITSRHQMQNGNRLHGPDLYLPNLVNLFPTVKIRCANRARIETVCQFTFIIENLTLKLTAAYVFLIFDKRQ